MIVRSCLIITLLCWILLLANVKGRGGRGGGGRSSGGSRSSRGSRGSSAGRSYSSGLKTAVAAGVVWNYASYRRSSYYRHYGDDHDPTLCERNKYVNNTLYTKFVCPEDGQSFDWSHCCGEAGKQTCCGYWDDEGRKIGTIVGIVAGTLILCIGVFCLIFCIVKSVLFKKNRSTSSTTEYKSGNVVITPVNYDDPPPTQTQKSTYTPPVDYADPPPNYNNATNESKTEQTKTGKE